LDEYKRNHPPSFELRELEIMVGRALRYEDGDVVHSLERSRPYASKSRKFIFWILIVLLIALIIYLILHFT